MVLMMLSVSQLEHAMASLSVTLVALQMDRP